MSDVKMIVNSGKWPVVSSGSSGKLGFTSDVVVYVVTFCW